MLGYIVRGGQYSLGYIVRGTLCPRLYCPGGQYKGGQYILRHRRPTERVFSQLKLVIDLARDGRWMLV